MMIDSRASRFSWAAVFALWSLTFIVYGQRITPANSPVALVALPNKHFLPIFIHQISNPDLVLRLETVVIRAEFQLNSPKINHSLPWLSRAGLNRNVITGGADASINLREVIQMNFTSPLPTPHVGTRKSFIFINAAKPRRSSNMCCDGGVQGKGGGGRKGVAAIMFKLSQSLFKRK